MSRRSDLGDAEDPGCLPIVALAALIGLGPLAVPVVLFLVFVGGVLILLLAGYEFARDLFRRGR